MSNIILMAVWGFIKKNWLPIGIIITLAFFTYYVYHKGVKDCEDKFEKAVQVEVEKRMNEFYKEWEENNHTQDEINQDIHNNPIDDKRDSCILSNNPFKANCLKKK